MKPYPGGSFLTGSVHAHAAAKKVLPACVRRAGAASAPVKGGCVAGGWRPSCIKQQFV